VNSNFSLRALTAQKTPHVQIHQSCYAAENPAIRARRSENEIANSHIAGLCCRSLQALICRFIKFGDGLFPKIRTDWHF